MELLRILHLGFTYLENQVAEKKGALTKVEGLDATFTKVANHQKLKVNHLDPVPSILTFFTLFSLFLLLTHRCEAALCGAYDQNTFSLTTVSQPVNFSIC